MTDPEIVEIPCLHVRPGDQSVRMNYVVRKDDGSERLVRFSFCETCARELIAGFLVQVNKTFPLREVTA